MKLNALREQRSTKVASMKALVDKAAAESRDLSAEEIKQFDALKVEERTLAAQVERAEYLGDLERRSAGEPVSGNPSADFDRLAGSVSVVKVLKAQMEGRSLDGAEGEYAKEAEKRSGRKAEGCFVPFKSLEKRANTTVTAPELIGTDHRAQDYIGPLRESLVARALGVRVLSGLAGNVSIPKFGSGLETGWITEGQPVPEGQMSFDGVTLTPKHVGGKTEMSRQLLQQSSPGIEQLVREDLSFLIAKQIDRAIINGSGAAGEPRGILNTLGIQTADMPDTWLEVLAMLQKLDDVEIANGRWLTTSTIRTLLAGTEKVVGSGSGFLYQGGTLADLPLTTSKNVPEKKLILGDFSQVLLGVWSEVDILVNPFAEPAYSRGGVQVRAMATVDTAVRHPQGFVVATGA
ncbi:major capsid protein [Pseudomonas frederiksbergensis]|uniref:Major capsid protein n=1 Tax=Pseudomonas frederiksbergensis TaxID=104087 RepID=A0A1J0EKB1_9PSED|nr:phage major capsid protein [Pseudomonas frederiksbergensis]APC16497.1 major capsid protein [Pseudomonas frederiksbergensis]